MVKQQKFFRTLAHPGVDFLLIAALSVGYACGPSSAEKKRIEPIYDQTTGKLQLLKYDADGDGKIDTWSYMDGPRVVQIEIDKNEDGKIDRWESYGPDQTLETVGFSRANDGKADAWAHYAADGSLTHIDVSTKHDGKVDRVEYYDKGALVRAEEDTDRDGKIDKWETYDGPRLASVAFDTTHRGTPERRLVYGVNGSARLELDPKGDGHFLAASAPAPVRRARK